MKAFIAVIQDSEMERIVVEMISGYKTRVLLGDFVGCNANFYEVDDLTSEKADELCKAIVKRQKDEGITGLSHVTRTDDKCSSLDFVNHCNQRQKHSH